jgi:hypothetical protein
MIPGGDSKIRVELPEPGSVPDSSGNRTALPPGVFLPGNDIVCRVEIARIDDKARAVHVVLGYRNTFHHEESEWDSEGNCSVTRNHTDQWWIPVARQQLSTEPPQPGVYLVRLAIPAAGPPTIPDMVDWQLKTVVDRGDDPDVTDTHDITVLTVPGMYDNRSDNGSPGRQELARRVPLRIRLREKSPHLVRGGLVEGEIFGNPAVDLNTQGIRIRLVHNRVEPDRDDQRKTVLDIALTEAFTAHTGMSFHIPFSFPLPENLTPTSYVSSNTHIWQLEAVADLPLAKDEVSTLPVILT